MRWFVSLLALATLCVSVPASRAQSESAESQVSVRPPPPATDAPVVDMVQLCSSRTAQRPQYPPKALSNRTPGRAVIDCSFLGDGRPRECQIVEETPPRLGFGQASLVMSCKFRWNASAAAAAASGATSNVNMHYYVRDEEERVRMSIVWRLED